MTGRRQFRLPASGSRDLEDIPELSAAEVERRSSGIAAERPALPARDSYEITQPVSRLAPGVAVGREPAAGAVSTPIDADAAVDRRRRVLWRDSATILIGGIVALLAFQVFLPGGVGLPSASSSELPSGVAIGSVGPPVSLPPGVTFGPIIDPSLGIDATPTPIPVITLGPTPTAAPSPSPSLRPSGTPKPTVKPTIRPTVKPTIRPTATPPTATPTVTQPPVTPPPSPNAVVACGSPVALTVTCTSSSTNIQADSENWSMGGPGGLVSGGNGSGSITWTYTDPGTYTVTLTVTGLDGSTTDTDTTQVTV